MNKDYFVHKSSFIDEDVKIGKGTKIWHFSHIQSGAIIGEECTLGQNVNVSNNVIVGNFCKIQNNVSLYEGVELEDYVFCGPSMVFTNIRLPRSEYPQKGSLHYEKTLVKKSASIGANSTIICGATIGEYSLIGSGSMVTKNVPAFSLVFGNPAKVIGWVSKTGERLVFDETGIARCKKSDEIYQKINNLVSIVE
ncbi:MAG: acyltransferase [Candidatus Neomarinimicrobiota bacterium]|nr:acyltransferase [Candidatus Neomarinimicrobiota bacterium]